MPKAMQWISGQQLMKLWDKDAFELFELISQGMTAYWRRDGNLEAFNPNDYEEFIVEITTPKLLFKPSDVEEFEKENEWLVSKGTDTTDASLSAKEQRELGRLRREKAKWDKSLEAAVHIGMFCAQLDHQITRKELTDEIYKIDPSLPNTTMDKIWKSIPEQHRKGAGAPKKQ